MHMFFLILSFEHVSRKYTKYISWHRDLEFPQKYTFNIVDADACELKKELHNWQQMKGTRKGLWAVFRKVKLKCHILSFRKYFFY